VLTSRHLLRMARWARHPPAAWRVKLVVGIFAAALLIAGIERFIGWPDILAVEPRQKVRFQPAPSTP